MNAPDVITPNEFAGSDSSRINQAIEQAAPTGRCVVIPRVNRTPDGERDLWRLDSAILVRSHTTLELNNCVIQLADGCRDNLIRSANCGEGVTTIEPLREVCIYGVGQVLLAGADRPRATGDSGKRLGQMACAPNAGWETFGRQSYGTDAGVAGAKQTGDWRNIGILLARVERFRIENLRIQDSHSWGISLERCGAGYVGRITFAAQERKWIDGAFRYVLNQDGLDLRLGCHDITIEHITGTTGDDLVALTNLADADGEGPGSLAGMEVSGSRYQGPEDDLRNITIRNVRGHSAGGHQVVRFLNTRQGQLYNVQLDGVIDTSPRPGHATVLIGSQHYGGRVPLGHTRRLFITNVSGASRHTVLVDGTLADSIIANVIHGSGSGDPVSYAIGSDGIRNVATANLLLASE